MNFTGKTYVHHLDHNRLSGQIKTIFEFMKDGAWRTPQEVSDAINNPNVCSVDANIRNLRKPENGGHIVMRRNRNHIRGFSEYKLIQHREHYVNPNAPKLSLVEMYDKAMEEDKFGADKVEFDVNKRLKIAKSMQFPKPEEPKFKKDLFQ